MASFEDFKINVQLLQAIKELQYNEPTDIQVSAIPQILAGHDIFGIAQTGTGKTAAYLIPILMKIKYAQGMNPRALILAPSRELAMQINDHMIGLAKFTDLRHTVIYGGLGPKTQIENIKKGLDIIVGTPGRVLDLYMRGDLILKDIKVLVLDEADKMMDMGFMPQIRKMLEVIPRKRQNLLFSATMPERVVKLSEEFLEFPLTIEVTPQATTVDAIDQSIYLVPNFLTKINFLQKLLEKPEFSRVIIFVRTKENADNLYKFIKRKIDQGVKVIHGNKGQNTRINSMEEFKSGSLRILVSTDVAARGIDVTMVSHVINFDVPVIYEDYVHRIGRTGRAGNLGAAITFSTETEMMHIKNIEKIINYKIPVLPLPDDVKVEETTFEEKQGMDKEKDTFKKKADPTFKGAFHDKKVRPFMNPYFADKNSKKKKK
ncbi:MAG TPA: DEAD/DEAH box helicase [Cytophagaceae bacterium]|jgi:ATP-dependent RNA helicase RhlE